MCNWRARARILRIGICRSEQKRSCGAKTADYPDKGDKNLLREDHSVWHSTSMHSVRGVVRSDHRKPGRNYRALGAEITNFGKNQFSCDGALLNAAAPLMAFCFRFPTHQSAEPSTDLFNWMLFSFTHELRIMRLAGVHFLNKFARKFS